MRERLKQLRQELGELVAANRAVLEAGRAEKRDLTAEETAEYETRDARIDKLEDEIKKVEKQIERESALGELEDRAAGGVDPNEDPNRGAGAVTPEVVELRGQEFTPPAWQDAEYREMYSAFLATGAHEAELEKRALSAGVDVEGGFTVAPMEFVARLIKFVDDAVFIRQRATVFPLSSGASMGAPSLDADPDDADWTGEITAATEDTGIAFGGRELTPHPLSKLVKISRKLLRISALNPEALVRDRLGYKFAITQEKGFLTGSGVNQALGVFTASPDGIPTGQDVLSGVTADVDGDSFIDLKHALKAAYWPRSAWAMSRELVKRARKLKDTTDQYIWSPGLQDGVPGRILDIPYFVSEYVPSVFTAGSYVCVLGDWSWYWIADSLALEVQRLVELYATTNQIGLIGRAEVDGMPVLAEAFVRMKTSS